jgi:predicted aminopeptidase
MPDPSPAPACGRPSAVAVRALVLLVCLANWGCADLRYAAQAARGQWQVVRAARPIAAVLADPATDPRIRARLRFVEELRQFAGETLQLPIGARYREYAALGREYVLWNVFAAPALALEPVPACYRFLGCFDYRGFFSRADAEAHAQILRAAGLDVYVGGVAAYSTLGWFDDPVLDGMLEFGDAELAKVLFHELAHGDLYVRDDTAFNEGYATVVGDAGLARYLATLAPEAAAPLAESERRDADFVRFLLDLRADFAAIYHAPLGDAEKLARKQALQASIPARYARWKSSWADYAGYDAFIGAGLNNAHFAAIATYHDLVPSFSALLQRSGGDLGRFRARAAAIAALAHGPRHACLRALSADPQRFDAFEPMAGQCGDH